MLQVFISYHRYVRVLKWLTLSLFSYVAVAFAIDVPWADVLHGALLPSLTLDPDYVTTVVAILGMVLVPFVHLSVYLFRTIHPMPVVLKPSAPSLPDSMLRTLLIAIVVDTIIYIGFAMTRYGLALAERAREGQQGEGYHAA